MGAHRYSRCVGTGAGVTSWRIETRDPSDARLAAEVDGWLDEQARATPFHRPAWMNAVRRSCGHDASYLIARRPDGRLSGLLPLHEVRSLLFGKALVSSGFAVGGGIIADDVAIADALANAGWAMARARGIATLELRGGLLPSGDGWHVDGDSYVGFTRPLARDDEAELLAIPRKQRAEVRRALGFGLETHAGRSRQDLDWHYRVYSESVRNLGTPVFPRALFREMLDTFGEEADILTVLHEARPVASVLSLYHRGVVMPYWGGGTHEARALRANDLMYFALMRHARARGCTTFDFGRSKPGTGAFAFKKNWGFVPVPLHYAARSSDGCSARAVNPLDPRYRRKVELWRKLPLMVANRIGPLIARGLG